MTTEIDTRRATTGITVPSHSGLILGLLCVCAFIFPLSIFVVAPLLVALSQDLGVSVGQAGQLVSFTAIPSALLAFVIGPISDRYGRRPTLVGGAAVLGIASIASAFAPTYEALAATRVLSGAGAAAMATATFAAVADLFPYAQRGRIYGYIITATTVATIGGVPAATILAAALGWRWSFSAVGLVTLAAAALLLRLYPRRLRGNGSDLRLGGDDAARGPKTTGRNLFLAAYLPVLETTTARAVLGSSFVMSVGSIGFQTFLGAFFIARYGVTTADLAPVLGIGSIGVLIGSQFAGRLGNRIGHKPIMSISVLVASVLALVELYTTTGVVLATLINFLIWVPMGMRFTSASTIISEAVPSARGTMNALNTASFNAGTVLGAYFGGVVVEGAGYEPLGLLMLAGAIVSAALIALFVVEADVGAEAGRTPSAVNGEG